MSREWQQTRFKEFVMPDAVYYQSIWAVRDLRRMENRIREIDRDVSPSYDGSLVSDRCRDFSSKRPTEKKAMEKILLQTKIKAIQRALYQVPEAYRDCVLNNVAFRKESFSCNPKIWKIWKQRFLYNVAKNLSLM